MYELATELLIFPVVHVRTEHMPHEFVGLFLQGLRSTGISYPCGLGDRETWCYMPFWCPDADGRSFIMAIFRGENDACQCWCLQLLTKEELVLKWQPCEEDESFVSRPIDEILGYGSDGNDSIPESSMDGWMRAVARADVTAYDQFACPCHRPPMPQSTDT